MVRIRTKKSIEEVYGSNLEANLPKVAAGAANQKQTRKDLGHSMAPLYEGSHTVRTYNQLPVGKVHVSPADQNRQSRKSTKPSQDFKGPHSYMGREDKVSLGPNVVNERQKKDANKLKTTRIEKDNNNMLYLNNAFDNRDLYNGGGFTSKDCANSSQLLQPSQSKQKYNANQLYQQREQKPRDDDEDAEEFFDMVKQTVEGAVAKTIADLLGRNLLEVNAKLDRFAAELKSTQNMLAKVQADVNKQIAHYGEEGAKHFRYLCMKSEYDKMFYQHQSLVGSVPTSSQTGLNQNHMSAPTMPSMAQMNHHRIPIQSSVQVPLNIPMQMHQQPYVSVQKPSTSRNVGEMGGEGDVKVPCSCRNAPENHSTSAGNIPASNLRNLSNISSEAGIREVLGQIQRFCNQLQADETGKAFARKIRPKRAFHPEDATIINKDVFALDEDDDCATSSDNYSPLSMEQMSKYESKVIKATGRPVQLTNHN